MYKIFSRVMVINNVLQYVSMDAPDIQLIYSKSRIKNTCLDSPRHYFLFSSKKKTTAYEHFPLRYYEVYDLCTQCTVQYIKITSWITGRIFGFFGYQKSGSHIRSDIRTVGYPEHPWSQDLIIVWDSIILYINIA